MGNCKREPGPGHLRGSDLFANTAGLTALWGFCFAGRKMGCPFLSLSRALSFGVPSRLSESYGQCWETHAPFKKIKKGDALRKEAGGRGQVGRVVAWLGLPLLHLHWRHAGFMCDGAARPRFRLRGGSSGRSARSPGKEGQVSTSGLVWHHLLWVRLALLRIGQTGQSLVSWFPAKS